MGEPHPVASITVALIVTFVSSIQANRRFVREVIEFRAESAEVWVMLQRR